VSLFTARRTGRARPVTTTEPLEVFVDLGGNYQPGRPATPPSYASGGDPPDPPMVEDVRATALYLEIETQDPANPMRRVDLLDGLDAAAKAQVLNNVLQALGESEVTDLLLDVDDDGSDDEPDYDDDPERFRSMGPDGFLDD
jgi:hypothetical protein